MSAGEGVYMDIDAVVAAISSVGFPIVCCAALFWRSYKDEERHAEENERQIEAYNKNTSALVEMKTILTTLADKIAGKDDEK